jgi:hypothetical protein
MAARIVVGAPAGGVQAPGRYERQELDSQAHAKMLREVLLARNGHDAGD